MSASVEIVGATDRGLVRQRNEDCIKMMPDRGIAILSDGMGGHLAGDVASRMAVDIVAQELRSGVAGEADGHGEIRTDVISALKKANHSIRSKAKSDPRCYGMGATIVLCVVSTDILISHLGDSRAYLYVDGALTRLTEDHTLAQSYLKRGLIDEKEAKTWSGRNLLIKGLGIESAIEPDISVNPVKPGGLYLLCSDGLTDVVSDEKILRKLRTRGHDLTQCARELIDLAISGGGPDNISVILLRTT